MRNMVIVGSGHAGCSAVRSLRGNGWTGGIDLLSNEDRQPYERPPLSKGVLSVGKAASEAPLLNDEWLASHAVNIIHGGGATSIDRDARTVLLSDGSVLAYEKLLLATGAAPRMPDIEGFDLPGVHSLRAASDAERLGRQLIPGRHLVIVGGGLIGLEVAASAVGLGCRVTVLESGAALLQRSAPAPIAEMVAALHRRRGVEIRTRTHVSSIEGTERAEAVRLADGSRIPCDVVLVSIGAVPRVDLAAAAGLALANGIVVDGTLRTSDANIFAAGDNCAFEGPSGKRIRFECWKNAEDQGELAARNMIGEHVCYAATHWMWSDQYDQVFQLVGLSSDVVDTIQRWYDDDTLLVFHLDANGRMVAASGFGQMGLVARGIRACRTMIERGGAPDPRLLADPAYDLRQTIRVRTPTVTLENAMTDQLTAV